MSARCREGLQAASPFSSVRLTQSPIIGRPHPSTYGESWTALVRAKESPLHCKSIQIGTFETQNRPCRWPSSGHSFQDALRTFFQPIKTDDPRPDFYTMYKREATEYNMDHVKKYDEDLNTTLIFVRCSSSALVNISLDLIGRSVLCRQLSFVINVHSSLQPDPNK